MLLLTMLLRCAGSGNKRNLDDAAKYPRDSDSITRFSVGHPAIAML
jgi:hypothetical protein